MAQTPLDLRESCSSPWMCQALPAPEPSQRAEQLASVDLALLPAWTLESTGPGSPAIPVGHCGRVTQPLCPPESCPSVELYIARSGSAHGLRGGTNMQRLIDAYRRLEVIDCSAGSSDLRPQGGRL